VCVCVRVCVCSYVCVRVCVFGCVCAQGVRECESADACVCLSERKNTCMCERVQCVCLCAKGTKKVTSTERASRREGKRESARARDEEIARARTFANQCVCMCVCVRES